MRAANAQIEQVSGRWLKVRALHGGNAVSLLTMSPWTILQNDGVAAVGKIQKWKSSLPPAGAPQDVVWVQLDVQAQEQQYILAGGSAAEPEQKKRK
jgi:hypothetical protein